MPESLDPAPVELQEEPSPVGPPEALSPERIEHYTRLLDTNVEFATRAAIAHRANLPFSEVVERWTLDDLAIEAALARRDIDSARHRCQGCGIDSRDQLTPGGRLGDNPVWRLDVYRCPWCEERDELQAKVAKERYTRAPPQVRYIPALPGEPFFDDRQIPTSVLSEEPPASEESGA